MKAGFGWILPKGTFSVRSTNIVRTGTPDDALRIAVNLEKEASMPHDASELAERYGWVSRPSCAVPFEDFEESAAECGMHAADGTAWCAHYRVAGPHKRSGPARAPMSTERDAPAVTTVKKWRSGDPARYRRLAFPALWRLSFPTWKFRAPLRSLPRREPRPACR